MCGICGYISKISIPDDVLIRMRDTMSHRGPNDAGIWQTQFSVGVVGLAHRRLSIFDLSELGHQPMLNDDGSIAIVFNGEIYNFRELRDELRGKGYIFKSECDTEVILHGYAEWHEECFSRFNGMFAIAIWDAREEKLVIARDRMGIKPLYYYWNPKTSDIAFASELKPILYYPRFSRNLDMEMLGRYLCYKYIASPGTIFEDTYKIQPGTYAVYKNNTVEISRYWDIRDKKAQGSERSITNYDQAKALINDILTDAVCKRMVADVPVGTFLSSGIDSALVTAIAQKHTDTPVRTFTIGFNEPERNEADKAREIAKYLGTDHTELYIGEKEIFDMLEDITDYYDEPFADSSQLPTMLVSKLASDNVTVALSGDGGDEIFCGYKMYDLVYIAQKVDFIGELLYHTPGVRSGIEHFTPEVRALINNRDEGYRTQLFIDVASEQVDSILGTSGINPKHSFETGLRYQNWQERRMILDMSTYLPDEIMTKTDRASMKYSLEVRSPLLDYRIVEASFHIPHKYKYHYFDKKHILKSIAYDYIPKELLSGPKRGFGVPLAKWLRGPLKEEIRQYSDEGFLNRQGIFDSKGIKKLINDQENNNKIIYSSILWSFYIFQRWWLQYCNN